MNVVFPNPGFLEAVQSLTKGAGALLVFDETITGFRFSKGGAQELFGVTPDLSTFGKGVANGFPLSAIVGRRDIMMEMEEIFFSGTFGGELLSLAAAKEVLTRHLSQDICGYIADIGTELTSATRSIIELYNLENVIKLSGHESWTFLNWSNSSGFSSDEIKTLFAQETFKRGVLVLSTHNVTLAHNSKERSKIIEVYSEVAGLLSDAISSGNLRELLEVKPLKPLFKVR